jgi:hypothetical protein
MSGPDDLPVNGFNPNNIKNNGASQPLIIHSSVAANSINDGNMVKDRGAGDKGVFFKNEAAAYRFLASHSTSVEQSAFITTNGVFVLPYNKNDGATASPSLYGYTIQANSTNTYTLLQDGKVILTNVIAHIHTHLSQSSFSGSDMLTSYNSGGLPMILMRPSGNIEAAFGTPPRYAEYSSDRTDIERLERVSNDMLTNGSFSLINYFNNLF